MSIISYTRTFRSFTPMRRGDELRVHSQGKLVELWIVTSVRADPENKERTICRAAVNLPTCSIRQISPAPLTPHK